MLVCKCQGWMNSFEPQSGWKSGIQTAHLKSAVKLLCCYKKSHQRAWEVPQEANHHHQQLLIMVPKLWYPMRDTTPGRGRGASATFSSPLLENEGENSSFFKWNKTTAVLDQFDEFEDKVIRTTHWEESSVLQQNCCIYICSNNPNKSTHNIFPFYLSQTKDSVCESRHRLRRKIRHKWS